MRTITTTLLKRNLADLMQDSIKPRISITNQHRDVVHSRYYTVTGEKSSDEQIDEFIETGEAKFQKAIHGAGPRQGVLYLL